MEVSGSDKVDSEGGESGDVADTAEAGDTSASESEPLQGKLQLIILVFN